MAQKTDAQLTTEANVIKNETAEGANTATRVGDMLNNIIDSKLNNEDAATDYLAIDGSNASANVDLGNYELHAKSIKINGTNGAGHIGLKHQNSNITANGSESSIGANSSGNPVWKNDGNTIESIMTNTQYGPVVDGMNAKTSMDDNDLLAIADSAASNASKKITWANFKASIQDATASVKGILKAYTGTGTNTDGTMTQNAITTAINAAKIGLWNDRGAYDASGNAYPSTGGSGTAGAIMKGDIWTVSVAGTLPTAQDVEVGDVVRALVDTPGNTQSNWAIMQNNIGYTAENNANKQTTLAGNETSMTFYPSIKGFVDWVGLYLFTFYTQMTSATASDRVLTGDMSASGETKWMSLTDFINSLLSTDAGQSLSVGTDTKLYLQEWRHQKTEAAGVTIISGTPITVGTFNGSGLLPTISFNSIQVFVDGILKTEVAGEIVWTGTDLNWGFSGTGNVTIYYMDKL